MSFPEKKKKILLAVPSESRRGFLPGWQANLFPEADCVEIEPWGMPREDWENNLRRIQPQVLVTGWGTSAVPENLASVEYICHLAGSVRDLVARPMLERGVLVSNWGTTISHTIAEHAVLLILGALRQAPLWPAFIRGSWPKGMKPKSNLQLRSLRGKKVGIHGFGAIVRELIPMLQSFQVEIAVFSAGVPRNMIEKYNVKYCESLVDLFGGRDILVECEALNEISRGSVGRDVLDLLPPGAVFVNVGRADVVDEPALAALAREKGWHLGLDVYVQEPLPASSPLLALPDAFLSPHVAGPTVDAFPACGDFALANIRRFLEGRPVEGRVTLEVYDRST